MFCEWEQTAVCTLGLQGRSLVTLPKQRADDSMDDPIATAKSMRSPVYVRGRPLLPR